MEEIWIWSIIFEPAFNRILDLARPGFLPGLYCWGISVVLILWDMRLTEIGQCTTSLTVKELCLYMMA